MNKGKLVFMWSVIVTVGFMTPTILKASKNDEVILKDGLNAKKKTVSIKEESNPYFEQSSLEGYEKSVLIEDGNGFDCHYIFTADDVIYEVNDDNSLNVIVKK